MSSFETCFFCHVPLNKENRCRNDIICKICESKLVVCRECGAQGLPSTNPNSVEIHKATRLHKNCLRWTIRNSRFYHRFTVRHASVSAMRAKLPFLISLGRIGKP